MSAVGRLRTRQRARARLEELIGQQDNLHIIHYSCESFYDTTNPSSRRITSIAIKHFGSEQTKSFSIHQMAERHGKLVSIEKNFDLLERAMLDECFAYIGQRAYSKWLHWHMRDANYGFAALEHRYSALGGTNLSIIPDHLKVDLPVLLSELYGPSYAPDPHMSKLADRNRISKLGFLSGKEEAEAFVRKEYVQLHQSTLRKVHVISDIFRQLRDGRIKTYAPWWHTHGLTALGIYGLVTEHWVWKLISLPAVPVGLAASVVTVWWWAT